MGTALTIELPGEPCGKGRPRFSRRTGHAYTPAKTRSYESMLQGAAIDAMKGRGMFEGALAVTVEAYFSVPPSWSKSKRAAALLNLTRPTKRPDADNIMKLLDSFNAVVWRDDAQIVEGTAIKLYSDRPRMVVKVMEITGREA